MILTFLIQFFFIFIFAAFAMTALDSTVLHDFTKLIAAGIKHFFCIKKALSVSVSSQLSRLSRFLNVLEN